jgi:hypothetical protein
VTQLLTARSRLLVIAEGVFFILALVSLIYATVTAFGEGSDLAMLQDIGRGWVNGVYQIGEGRFYGHPPFASVLYSPLAALSFEQLRAVFVLVNLLATCLILLFVRQLWGTNWSARAHWLFAALLLSWAPFRVTLRYGQISLILTALVLGALLAWKRKKSGLAGLLIGLSLAKYSLALPFALYFAWRREWKIVAVALLTVGVLTEVAALRLGLSPFVLISDYYRMMQRISISNDASFSGATEIGRALFALTGSEPIANQLNIALAVIALASMGLVFWHNPQCEGLHLAALTFFSLWFVYHRIYDAVICILPAAVFVDFTIRNKLRRLSLICLATLGLLSLSIPGLLTERLHLGADKLSANPAGFLVLHLERLLVFGMFWLLLVALWRAGPDRSVEPADDSSSAVATART